MVFFPPNGWLLFWLNCSISFFSPHNESLGVAAIGFRGSSSDEDHVDGTSRTSGSSDEGHGADGPPNLFGSRTIGWDGDGPKTRSVGLGSGTIVDAVEAEVADEEIVATDDPSSLSFLQEGREDHEDAARRSKDASKRADDFVHITWAGGGSAGANLHSDRDEIAPAGVVGGRSDELRSDGVEKFGAQRDHPWTSELFSLASRIGIGLKRTAPGGALLELNQPPPGGRYVVVHEGDQHSGGGCCACCMCFLGLMCLCGMLGLVLMLAMGAGAHGHHHHHHREERREDAPRVWGKTQEEV